MEKDKFKYQEYILWFILLLGVLLRITVYFQNRSLFLDEANVARNIVEKNYLDFFSPLDYDQFVPPLLSIIFKCSTSVFGNNEYALRLFPLMIGIASVFAFYHFSKKIIKENISLIFVNWVFATSFLLIQYATEAKQYGIDVFMTILLLNAALSIDDKIFNKKEVLKWMLLGFISIWFSMSSFFVLAGIGFYFIIKKWTFIKKSTLNLLPILLLGFSWLLSFGIYYYLILSKGIASEAQQNYHSQFFLPIIPTSIDSLNQWTSIQGEIMRSTIGKTGVALGFGIVFLLIGWLLLFKEKWKIAFLFSIPILLAWLASSLGQYSLLPRLALYYLPISLCAIGFGFGKIWSKSHKYLKWFWCVLLLVVASHQWGYKMFWEPLAKEEIKPVLKHIISQAEKEDMIYVHFSSIAAYDFYTTKHDLKESHYDLSKHPTVLANWDAEHPQLSKAEPSKIWLVFSHIGQAEKNRIKALFLEDYKEKHYFESIHSSCIELVKK